MAPAEARLCYPTEKASQGLLGDGHVIKFLISALGVSMLQYLSVFIITTLSSLPLHCCIWSDSHPAPNTLERHTKANTGKKTIKPNICLTCHSSLSP